MTVRKPVWLGKMLLTPRSEVADTTVGVSMEEVVMVPAEEVVAAWRTPLSVLMLPPWITTIFCPALAWKIHNTMMFVSLLNV